MSVTAANITFLTNIPNPYNHYLYDSLRDLGLPTAVVYRGTPASEGRPWTIEPGPHERIAPSLWSERKALLGPRPGGSTIVLCGSWASRRDAMRRALTVCRPAATRVVTWGERMSDRQGLRRSLRRLYFAPVGLDAVLAIGTWSVPSYRAATGGRVPVHVFPYTTDSGLSVERRRSTQPLIGFSGRLIEGKGLEVLLRALGRLPTSDRPALDVIGSGPLGDSLAALAVRLGVVAVFHGEVSPDALASIRARWWLSVTPSQLVDGWVDGWSLVVPEALNGGVPVVASGHVGAAHDLLREGVNGSMVSAEAAEDPQAWSDAIGSLLAEDLAELSDNARAIGSAFSARPGARWLRELLATDLLTERSFIADVWKQVG